MSFGKAISYVLRNLARRPARTLLTAGMIVLGVAALVVSLSWMRGVFGSLLSSSTAINGHVSIARPEFAQRQELQPLQHNLTPSAALVRAVAESRGVVAVEERIVTSVTLSVRDEIGDVFAPLVGANERYFRARLQVADHLVAGHWFSGARGEAVIGAELAAQVGASAGQTLIVLGTTQDGSLSSLKAQIVGIYRSGIGGLDQQLLMPLDDVRYLVDMPFGATELLVYGSDYASAGELAAQLSSKRALAGLTVQSWSAREPWRSLARSFESIERIIVLITVFVTALGIWNTMMMSVLERTHEIGVLRALGLSRLGAVVLFTGEALSVAVLGGLLGLGLGLYPAWWLEQHGLSFGDQTAAYANLGLSETMHGRLTVGVVATAFGLGLLMALLGSVIPSVRAASIAPATAMRTGR